MVECLNNGVLGGVETQRLKFSGGLQNLVLDGRIWWRMLEFGGGLKNLVDDFRMFWINLELGGGL